MRFNFPSRQKGLFIMVAVAALAMPAFAQKAPPQYIDSIVENHRRAIQSLGAEGFSCYQWGEGSALVLTQTSPDDLRRHLEGLPGDGFRRSYVSASRLTATANSGSNVPLRTPMIVTYSFLPDGTTIPGAPFVGDSASQSNLFANFDGSFPQGSYGSRREAWKAEFAQMFNALGQLTGLTFQETSDDGAGFPSFPGAVGLRGDIRIGMKPIGSQAAAYNYYPNNSDMVLDSFDLSYFINPNNDFVLLRNVLAHEIGHGLGFDHVAPTNQTKLMEPVVGSFFDGPQQDDIRGLQRIYGDTWEANDSPAAALFIGQPAAGAIELHNLSLEDDGLNDYYKFSLPQNAAISVILTPIGNTYTVGPVGGTAVSVDALRIHDLAFEIRGAGGTSVLAQVNDTGAGEVESLSGFTPGPAGEYYVRVYPTTSTDDVQRYTLFVRPSYSPGQIVNHIIGRQYLPVDQRPAADRNGNGKIESGDLINIVKNP